jgi:hypothetical protein
MKRKMGIVLTSGLGAAFVVGGFAEPASAARVSCTNQYAAMVQAQQTYDAWNNTVWGFENSVQTTYTMGSDGVAHVTVHVEYQYSNGTWVEQTMSQATYASVDAYYQNKLELAGNNLADASDAYASDCGFAGIG